MVTTEYEKRLEECGVVLALDQQFTRAKDQHRMICTNCAALFTATPISIIQIFNKWGTNGCTSCRDVRKKLRECDSRQVNKQKLIDRGFEILSDWDGRNCTGATNTSVPVTVKQTKCGHTFTSNAVNLLRRGINCSVCGKLERSGYINKWSELNSARWRQTAPEWKIYRSEVQKHTRVTYKKHKSTINPAGLPTGRAGTDGAYHLDHIVPVRWCFERNVPPQLVADVTNLQMLPWLDNIASRDHLKTNLPTIFQSYVT